MRHYSPDQRLLEVLGAAKSPVIFTHVYPDGDAIGSELALFRALEARGARPAILNAHPSPLLQEFLDPDGQVEVANGEPSAPQLDRLRSADLLIVVDTSESSRLGRLEDLVLDHQAPKVCIDHHLSEGPSPFDPHWCEPGCPAAGLLVKATIEALGVELTPELAEPLFVAIATDTGWFRYGNADSLAFQAAAELVEAGANPSRLYSALFESSSLDRTQMLGEMLAALRAESGGRVVLAEVGRAQLDRRGIQVEEVDGFVDSLKEVRGAEILALFVEVSPGKYKVSLRAKGDQDVHRLAVHFGGGGHVKAAGYRTEGSRDDVIGAFLEAAASDLGLDS